MITIKQKLDIFFDSLLFVFSIFAITTGSILYKKFNNLCDREIFGVLANYNQELSEEEFGNCKNVAQIKTYLGVFVLTLGCFQMVYFIFSVFKRLSGKSEEIKEGGCDEGSEGNETRV